jgi:hypothetical protein
MGFGTSAALTTAAFTGAGLTLGTPALVAAMIGVCLLTATLAIASGAFSNRSNNLKPAFSN